ncbi:MAG: glycosyltransferase family 4 protein [Clostridium sp.]|nr:glycosyltransferase family 4 protein [Clostridium sp.]
MQTDRKLKIVVIGTRGIPEIPGGVETHCQELYPRLATMGHDVTVIRRTPYITDENRTDNYRGVSLADIYAPKRKSLEAFVHTLLATLKARTLSPDILHIHAVGPSLLVPLARLLGMKVVMTNHGPDYDRQKWGRLAKTMLRTGERLGTRWSNRVIAISGVIAGIISRRYGRTEGVDLIYNGVTPPSKSTATDYITSLGLEPRRYIVGMGRFVEEKGFHDLIEALRRSRLPGDIRLVLAGDTDHPDEYSERLKQTARDNGVVMTGYIRGERMNQLMSNAALYAMPSYHEGLPIALLEAMSYGLDVAVSDIPANRLPELSPDDFFATGDCDALAALLERKIAGRRPERTYDLSAYDWDRIAEKTAETYYRAVGR